MKTNNGKNKKETFIVRTEWDNAINKKSDYVKARLLDNLMSYHLDRPLDLTNESVETIWDLILPNLERNIDYYNKTVEAKKEAGKLGGLKSGESRKKKKEANEARASNLKQKENLLQENEPKSKQTEANEASASSASNIHNFQSVTEVLLDQKSKHNEANEHDTDLDTDSDLDSDSDLVTVSEEKKEKNCTLNKVNLIKKENPVFLFDGLNEKQTEEVFLNCIGLTKKFRSIQEKSFTEEKLATKCIIEKIIDGMKKKGSRISVFTIMEAYSFCMKSCPESFAVESLKSISENWDKFYTELLQNK